MRHHTLHRPVYLKDGDYAFGLSEQHVIKRTEIALTISLITNRNLFGMIYSRLAGEYFQNMPKDSGLYICPVVPTRLFSREINMPGDIDLLIIPYEGSELILHRVMAWEIKAIRATFLKQGRSPNDFGFSQARGLLKLGFPYVAVAHLIVSDDSPPHAWREMAVAKALDAEGRVEFLPSIKLDCLPSDLVRRSYGRMLRFSNESTKIGLVSAYLGSTDSELTGAKRRLRTWHPVCRACLSNPDTSLILLGKIAKFFDTVPDRFFDTPRYDPPYI